MNKTKSLHIVNFIWYFSLIFIGFSFVYGLLSFEFNTMYLIPIIYHVLFYATFVIPFIYFTKNVKDIILIVHQNNFVSLKTSMCFRKMSKSVYLFLGFPLLHLIQLMYYPTYVSSGNGTQIIFENVILKYPLQTFTSAGSPLVPIILIVLFGVLFDIVSKAMSYALEMQNELDDIV